MLHWLSKLAAGSEVDKGGCVRHPWSSNCMRTSLICQSTGTISAASLACDPVKGRREGLAYWETLVISELPSCIPHWLLSSTCLAWLFWGGLWGWLNSDGKAATSIITPLTYWRDGNDCRWTPTNIYRLIIFFPPLYKIQLRIWMTCLFQNSIFIHWNQYLCPQCRVWWWTQLQAKNICWQFWPIQEADLKKNTIYSSVLNMY